MPGDTQIILCARHFSEIEEDVRSTTPGHEQ